MSSPQEPTYPGESSDGLLIRQLTEHNEKLLAEKRVLQDQLAVHRARINELLAEVEISRGNEGLKRTIR